MLVKTLSCAHTSVDITSCRQTKIFVHPTCSFDIHIHFHIFWGSLVCVPILMFIQGAFSILLSLVSLESKEKLTGTKIDLKPLKWAYYLPLDLLKRKVGSLSWYSASHREDSGLPHTIWMQHTQEERWESSGSDTFHWFSTNALFLFQGVISDLTLYLIIISP